MTENFSYEERQRRPRKKRVVKKGRLLFFGLLFATVLLCSLWYLVLGIKTLIFHQLLEIQDLQSSVVRQEFSIQGVLIKQEYPISLPLKGSMKFTVSDGERVKAGTQLGILSASDLESASGAKTYTVKSTTSGMLCTHVDGFENILIPGNIDIVQIPSLDKINSNGVPPTVVEKGQVVAKVIDNLAPIYVYGHVTKEQLSKIEAKKDSGVKVHWQQHLLEAKVDKLISNEQPGMLLILKNYPDEIMHQRKIDFQLVIGELEGLLVDEASLVSKDNSPGLYILWKGLIRWVPVEITNRMAGKVQITGQDLQPGIRYILNPEYAREGDRIQ
ncbi:HlyD family efflux transporter periplasmic adaptor subunit [Desulforamulus aeronauticus]|uniref:Putative membrane fusion protein n=1 Tax=Desulforamulus aeronauticus DSM 10349 TaxID=1121421 RepID=A0A1M6PP36_9FIRM|nr:HlyD family efflux transporter periplasmic adaptor subunit [Desulforamulus aeronauticus]SHK09712.1 putative membrane fusion protein [Desulforamulus aeronauticus DSM 10349]